MIRKITFTDQDKTTQAMEKDNSLKCRKESKTMLTCKLLDLRKTKEEKPLKKANDI
jgi:hypothetical protein